MMKLSHGIWLPMAILFGHALSQSAIEMAEEAYPACTLLCLAEIIPTSPCGLTDVECLCTNQPFNANLTECVMETCTMYEALQTKNVSMTMCGGEVRDDSTRPLLIGLIGGALAFVVFILRMCSGLPSGSRVLGWDDYMIVLAVAFAVPPTVFAVTLTDNGLGKDIWRLPPENIEKVLFYYYLGELFYFCSITAIKTSIVCCTLRIFPSRDFQRWVWAVMGLCLAYGVSFLFATMFQCSPISYSWMQLNSHWEGRCNNIHLQGWLSAAFNIVVDVVVVALPLRNLLGLQMNLKKKLMIMFMFSLGIFVTIISVIRLRSLIVFANTQNPTWDYNEAAWWSTLEIHLGIIGACLPALRSFFISHGVRALRTKNGISAKTSSSKYVSNKSDGGRTTGSKMSATREALAQGVPKRGDEQDFIPLVDVMEKGGYSSTYCTRDDSGDKWV